MKMMISIVTATYNREKELVNLMKSLKRNYDTFKDFEWIVIDDGSSDLTKKSVKKWTSEVEFPIVYEYQENSGKMKAINRGMELVRGELVLEIDSDDYLEDRALKTISEDYKALDKGMNIYGLLYRRRLASKKDDLSKLDSKVFKLFEMHNKYGYDFDMVLVFVSEIRKKFIYEVVDDEKFVTEARLYYKLDSLYDGMVFLDKELVVCEYLSDGYSKNIKDIFLKYPKGYYEYFKECLGYANNGVLFKKRLYFIKHLILFGYLTGRKKSEVIKDVRGLNKFLVMLLVVPGYIKSKSFGRIYE